MRKPVHHPLPAVLGNKRQPKGRVAGYVWKDASIGRWRFETVSEPCNYDSYRTERDATAACLVADIEQRMRRDADSRIERLTAERDEARNAAKAQADLGICLEVVCDYRGPRGERYSVEFLDATA